MKNKFGKAAALLAAAAVAAGVCAVAACGGDSETTSETYTVSYTTSEISGNVRHTGYLTSQNATETNTLVLSSDGTYVYTKYVSNKDSSDAEASSYEALSVTALSDEDEDDGILFSWTAEGTCTLDFYEDGTYIFAFPSYGMSESGTWTWENWTMTVTTAGGQVFTPEMDDDNTLSFTYVSDANSALYEVFSVTSSVWGVAFAGSGSYTPTESSSSGDSADDEKEEEDDDSTTSYIEISYEFTGTYTEGDEYITLNPAEHCTWSENWGPFTAYGFQNVSGTEDDVVYPKTSTEYYLPLDHFGGQYYYAPTSPENYEVTNNIEVYVSVSSDGSFDYVEVSVFD